MLKKMLMLLLAVCMIVPTAAGAAYGESGKASSKIAMLLPDGTPLMEDGTAWVTYTRLPMTKIPLPMGGDLKQIAGSSEYGFGVNNAGGLVMWGESGFQNVAGQSNVKQVGQGYWLTSDGNVNRLDSSKPQAVKGFEGISIFDENKGIIGGVTQSGTVLYHNSAYTPEPVALGQVTDVNSIRKIKVAGDYAAILYNDGRLVLFSTLRINGSTTYLSQKLIQDAADISFGKEQKLIIVKKDGTVWNAKLDVFTQTFEMNPLNGISGVQQIVGIGGSKSFFAQLMDGTWIEYDNGQQYDVPVPSITSVTLKVSNSKPKVGSSITPTVEFQYGNGEKHKIPGNMIALSVDKPHIIKAVEKGAYKILGVGEATLTVDIAGKKQSVKIVSGLGKPLENAKQEKGITYLPLKRVFEALGGTVQYQAASKTFDITIGETEIYVKAGSKQAKINGKTVNMKGAPIQNKGETLVSADLLTAALGAKLKWDASKQQMTVALGSAQFVVKGEQKKAQNSSSGGTSGKSKMSAVNASGSMAGWKLLKGHEYEKSLRIYFQYKNGILATKTEDIRKVDLNKKVTWTDDNGRKRTNTVREIYSLFTLSNEYTSEWLLKKFGKLYEDWMLTSLVDANRIVEQYLQETGQMPSYAPNVTLTPDAVFEYE
ncbi:copper amine oxidase N-terminal domain-containing protein [Paenibacillus glucanolyticus]|uniref:copper amine oxidase N-terminal domain-containing protein n=1 Tax=Paenibacillus glucanolyticus TaxID=59843 RepID=UPI0030C93038